MRLTLTDDEVTQKRIIKLATSVRGSNRRRVASPAAQLDPSPPVCACLPQMQPYILAPWGREQERGKGFQAHVSVALIARLESMATIGLCSCVQVPVTAPEAVVMSASLVCCKEAGCHHTISLSRRTARFLVSLPVSMSHARSSLSLSRSSGSAVEEDRAKGCRRLARIGRKRSAVEERFTLCLIGTEALVSKAEKRVQLR